MAVLLIVSQLIIFFQTPTEHYLQIEMELVVSLYQITQLFHL